VAENKGCGRMSFTLSILAIMWLYTAEITQNALQRMEDKRHIEEINSYFLNRADIKDWTYQ